MRSLVVTTWFPDATAPSRTPFCLEHVLAIQSAGHEVHVVHVALGKAHGPAYTEVYAGAKVTRTRLDVRNPLSVLSVTRLIAMELRKTDILHTMAFSSILVASAANAIVRRPWIHTEHWNGVISPASVGSWWKWMAFLRHALRLPQRVTGVTSQLVAGMERFCRGGASAVVPCVVEPLPTLAPFPNRPPLVLVGVGLLVERKRPLLALEAIAWLAHMGTKVKYIWVGDGPLMPVAIRQAEALGISELVNFVGAVPPGDVPGYLSQGHLFFVPSSQENFFTAVAEAISAGRPAVVPLSGGFDDYCNEANSVLAPGGGGEELGRAILKAAEKFGNTSPQEIAATLQGRFSRERVGSQFDALYREMAD